MKIVLLKFNKCFLCVLITLVCLLCTVASSYDILDTRPLYSAIISFNTSSVVEKIPFENSANEFWNFDATKLGDWATVSILYNGYSFPVKNFTSYNLPPGCTLSISVSSNTAKGRACHFVASSSSLVVDLKIMQSGNSTYSGGYGTLGYPYQLASSYDILSLSLNTYDYGKYFLMTSDIDMDGMLFNNSIFARDVYINNGIFDGVAFSGQFDGNTYTLSDFYINGSSDYLGTFGYLNGGSKIKNLSIEDITIKGVDYVGGILGSNDGTVINCSVNDSLVIGVSIIGGAVGINNGLVQKTSTGVEVSGLSKVAGLVGYNTGEISQSYSFATVKSHYIASGLVAWNTGLIQNCYNYGSVIGADYAAGLLSVNYGGTLKNSYTLSDIAGTNSCDGVVAINLLGGIVQSCGAQGYNLSKQQMHNSTIYTSAGWDFANESVNGDADIWLMEEYPKLRCFKMSYMGWISLQIDNKYLRGYEDCPAGDGVNNMLKYMFDIPAMQVFNYKNIKSSIQVAVENNRFAVSYYKSKRAQDCEIFPQEANNGWQRIYDISLTQEDRLREKLTSQIDMDDDAGYVNVKVETIDVFNVERKAIMLGCGVTSGSWPTEGSPWPERFDWLRPDLTCLNLGDSRTYASDGAEHINQYMYTFDPKYVLIMYGINDITAGISVSNIKSGLRYMVQVVLGYGRTPVLATIPSVPKYTSYELRLVRQLNDGIKEMGEFYDIQIADVDAVLDDDDYFLSDGLHPTRRGNELIALEFFKTMQLDICR